MRWIFENFGLLVFVFIAISIARAMRKAMQQKQDYEASTDESEEQRNMRRVREEIRRKIAERRGGAAVEPPPLVTRGPGPVTRHPVPAELPRPIALPDLFEGPMKRMLAELEGRGEPPRPAPPVLPVPDGAALARQEQLEEQMRVLEETRMLARRRAAEIAAMQKTVAESAAGARVAARGTLLADLHDPQSLRRAFVLREVLGPPVALR